LVAGGFRGPDNTSLDAAWRAILPRLAIPGRPLLTGGRSAGARVAGRTARDVGAAAVLALSFPLHAPGRPDQLWDTGELFDTALPTLIVQGGQDPFGRPRDFPPLPAGTRLVEVPNADHVFDGADITVLTDAVLTWLDEVLQHAGQTTVDHEVGAGDVGGPIAGQ
jgi:uncharacterized protein